MSDAAPPRAAISATMSARLAEESGIDEPMIERLVRRFYDRVRADPLLGPIFHDRVASWDEHLDKLTAFWSSVALSSGAYRGQPMQAHMDLPVDARHFDRWLALFEAAAADTCPPAAAERFIEKARRIAESLELGVAGANGQILAKGERFVRGEPSR